MSNTTTKMRFVAKKMTNPLGITINDHSNLIIAVDPMMPDSAIEVICNRINNLFWVIDNEARREMAIAEPTGPLVGDAELQEGYEPWKDGLPEEERLCGICDSKLHSTLNCNVGRF